MKNLFKLLNITFLSILFLCNISADAKFDDDYKSTISDKYQLKTIDAIEKKFDLINLSEDDIQVLKNSVEVTNKDNYKILDKIIKKDNIEDLKKVSDLTLNNNLKKANADAQMYQIAYTYARNGLFMEVIDEKLMKSVVEAMYDCEQPVDEYKLTVYGAAFLFHKEDNLDFKTLLDSVNKDNYKTVLSELKTDAKFDSKRFFPNNKEVAVILTNLPKSMQNEIDMQDYGKKVTLSPAECIINPKYYATNMILISTGMEGASKSGAIAGLVNPLNIMSDIVLSPIYFMMSKLLKEPLKDIQEL